MKIGELAHQTQTTVETIRYYEKIGLLPPAARNSNNYRHYNAEHAARLIFIHNCRLLGLSHKEIRALSDLNTFGGDTCADVLAILDAHQYHIKSKIAHLQQLAKKIQVMQGEYQRRHREQNCAAPQLLQTAAIAPPLQEEKITDIHHPDYFRH